jgi:hypothetical protein
MASNCKVVNVILNSNNKASGTNNQATYYIDWSSILKNNQAYYLHFTYIGGKNTIDGSNLALLYGEFNTSNKLNTATASGAMSSQMLGFLKPIVFVGSTNADYLQAEDNTNSPTYLDRRPNNNQFTITVYDNAATPALWKDQAAVPVVNANYVLMLSFRECDDE